MQNSPTAPIAQPIYPPDPNGPLGQPHIPYKPQQPYYPPSSSGSLPVYGFQPQYVQPGVYAQVQPNQTVVPNGPQTSYQPNTFSSRRSYPVAVGSGWLSKPSDGRNNGNEFDDPYIRNAFIRKVYLILFAQLSITALLIAVCLFTAVFFVTYIVLACCGSFRRYFPWNYIALLIFTISFSYVAAAVSCAYKTHSVLATVGITALMCLVITVLALSSCIDLTRCWALILILSIVLMIFGLACGIVYAVIGYNAIMHTVYGGVAATACCIYLMFDTQMIIGGRTNELSEEEYIFGALQLYMDIMNLFLIMLSLTGDHS